MPKPNQEYIFKGANYYLNKSSNSVSFTKEGGKGKGKKNQYL